MAAWKPGAGKVVKQDGGAHESGFAPQLVWHTTEGLSLPNNAGSAPHFTIHPNDALRTATEPDGMRLHAPLGELPYDAAEDRVQCHLCGGWYRALAPAHLQRHAITAEEYRAITGLNPSLALTTPSLSALRRRQLRARVERDERLQAGMRAGLALARSGVLQTRAREAARERGPRVQRSHALIDGGRELGLRRAAAFRQQRELRSQHLGFDTLESYLRQRYLRERRPIDDLAHELGVSTSALRGDFDRFAIGVRRESPRRTRPRPARD